MTPIPPIDYDRYLFHERDVHPVTANTRADGRELLAEAWAARVKPWTTLYPLNEATRALRDLKSGRLDGTAVLRIGS
jgi:propanol-preferring alcohol dehydrogenase